MILAVLPTQIIIEGVPINRLADLGNRCSTELSHRGTGLDHYRIGILITHKSEVGECYSSRALS